ncbi:MAG TPA: hypothetical protein VHX88_00905 [Solirubrobacteraceae bacterium]|jgi:hypothetical protein|nr:hypothetical protein [Solirubrobacteraceae bacterium]
MGRRLAVALGLLLAAAVVAVVLATRSSSPRAADGTGGVSGAAIVQRRDLVVTDTESGTLGYADPQTAYDRLSGTITWLPGVGRVIYPGQTLYSVSGRPVVLLDGALPAYRALTATDGAGRDILQLNRDLVQMGFADEQVTVTDAWQAGTTAAVKRWQAALDEKQSGTIALGQIVFLPGPQRVTQLETTCGAAGEGAGAASGAGPANGCGVWEASATTPTWHVEDIDYTTTTTFTTPTTPATTTPPTTTTTPTSTTTTTATTAPPAAKPPSPHKHGSSDKGAAAKASGSKKSSASASSPRAGKPSSGSAAGGDAGSAVAILQTTSTRLVVTVDLSASSQSEAVVGSRVTVEMPNGSTVAGTITAVSAVAQSSSSSGGNQSSSPGGSGGGAGSGGSSATVPVTIALDRRVAGAGLDQAAVSVNFTQAKARHVLSVPVTALIATSGQSYAVQQASPPYRLIAVSTGLFAAGYVQISGPGIGSGLQVTDSQG